MKKGKDLNRLYRELRKRNWWARWSGTIPGIGIMQQIRQSNIKYYDKTLIKKDLDKWLDDM